MLAGVIGTVAMDAVRYLHYRRDGGTKHPLKWEFASSDNWEKVSAPGQLGKRLAEGFLQRPLPAQFAATTDNVVHWAYGAAWGGLYGLTAGSMRRPRLYLGPLFGTAVWLTSYLVLPAAGLYRPIWQYDPKTLVKDWSAHLAYGVGTSVASKLMK